MPITRAAWRSSPTWKRTHRCFLDSPRCNHSHHSLNSRHRLTFDSTGHPADSDPRSPLRNSQSSARQQNSFPRKCLSISTFQRKTNNMGLVTDATPRAQQVYGGFKPKSDLRKWGVAWAAVEGGNDSRFPSLGEICGDGIQVSQGGSSRLVYEEARFEGGKTNDIVRGGIKLREVRVPIEDVRASQAISADEHNELMRKYGHAQ